MRITYLHQYFNTLDMPGGTRSYEFARRMAARGHEVQLLTTERRGGPRPERWWVTDEDGINVHWTHVPYSNEMSYSARLRAFAAYSLKAAVRASAIPADVVFASSTPLTIALPGVYVATRRRAPLVLEVRDLWPEVPIALGVLRNPLTRTAARQLESFAYAHSQRVVALSPGMRDGVVMRGFPADRVDVIPNAADVELFKESTALGEKYRRSDPWIADRPLVVYCGTVGTVNGVGYLVRLAESMLATDPEVRFIVAGSGRCLPAVIEEARARGVFDVNFRVIPEIAKREVPMILGAADIAMSTVIDVPELHANSANKFFDALAAGTPMAINHEGWQAELLRRNGAGIVLPASDSAGAASMLHQVLRSPETCNQMGIAARRLAEAQFDRDDLADRFEACLLSAVEAFRGERRAWGTG